MMLPRSTTASRAARRSALENSAAGMLSHGLRFSSQCAHRVVERLDPAALGAAQVFVAIDQRAERHGRWRPRMRNRCGCGCAGVDAFGSPASRLARLLQAQRREMSKFEARVFPAAPVAVGPCAALGANSERQARHDRIGPGARRQCRDCESGELLFQSGQFSVSAGPFLGAIWAQRADDTLEHARTPPNRKAR